MFGGGFLPEVTETGEFRTRLHPYLEFYSPSTREWWRAELPARGLADISLLLTPDGNIMITGTNLLFTYGDHLQPIGVPLSDEPPIYRVFLFEPQSAEFTELPPTTVPRFSPQFVALDDGWLVAAGGSLRFEQGVQTTEESLLEFEVYDPVQGLWKHVEGPDLGIVSPLIGPQPEVLMLETLTLSGGAAVVLFTQVEEEDPVGMLTALGADTASWTTLLDFDTLYGIPDSAIAGSDGNIHLLYEERMETYDPQTGEVLVGYSREALPVNAGHITTAGEHFLFAKGNIGGGWSEPSASVSVLDLVNHVWLSGEYLRQGRVGHSLTALPNGNVLVFGGLVASLGDDQELIPTSRAEILPAEILAGNGIAVLRRDASPNARLWSECLGLNDVEEPRPSLSDALAPTESAEELLEMAVSALDALDSYAFTYTSGAYWHEHFSMERGRSIVCEFDSQQYQAPHTISIRSQSNEGPELFSYCHEMVIGNEGFSIQWPSSAWNRFSSEGAQLPRGRFRDLLENRTAALTYIGVETLDGVDVFHVREQSTLSEGRTSFWIGVDDLLLRRIRREQQREPSAERIEMLIEEEREEFWVPRHDSLTEFHSFNEDFNIQPPPEDQIAE